ncbi:MAG: hypothetical protein WD060_05550 [Pirellulales bacterium]
MRRCPVATAANVSYGPHPKQVLDLRQAPSASAEKPTPLLFSIHGGGWRGGDRSYVAAMLKPMLDAGVAVVSISYRFIDEATAEKVEPPFKGLSNNTIRFCRGSTNTRPLLWSHRTIHRFFSATNCHQRSVKLSRI